MNIYLKYLYDVELEELVFIQNMTKDWSEEKIQQFACIYRARRRAPILILGTTLVGFIGFGGIQRFLLGQIGMGILYLFTYGLCLIGTIVDAINYKNLAFEYNRIQVHEIIMMMK